MDDALLPGGPAPPPDVFVRTVEVEEAVWEDDREDVPERVEELDDHLLYG